MNRVILLLLLIAGILLVRACDPELWTMQIRSQRQISRLSAPTNARINIEGALGVSLNQGSQSLQLTPTDILFGLNTSPFMILQGSTGNVGIGTASPSQKLHLNPGRILLSGGTAAVYFTDTNRGLIYSKTPNGQQSFTSNFPRDGMALFGYLDGCLGTTDINNGGSKAVLSWTSAGAVTVNPTNTSIHYPLAVYGYSNVDRGSSYIYMNDPATAGTGQFRASIYAQFGVVSGSHGFMTLSDQRIKKNIEQATNALDTISKLDVVSYDHIDSIKEGRVRYGVLAQQVREQVPTSVHTIKEYIPNVFQKVLQQFQSPQGIHLFFQDRIPVIVGKQVKVIVGEREFTVKVLDQGTHSLIVEQYYPITEQEVFVYGTLEEDFLVVDKAQLGILALQGVKELMKEVVELRELVRELRK